MQGLRRDKGSSVYPSRGCSVTPVCVKAGLGRSRHRQRHRLCTPLSSAPALPCKPTPPEPVSGAPLPGQDTITRARLSPPCSGKGRGLACCPETASGTTPLSSRPPGGQCRGGRAQVGGGEGASAGRAWIFPEGGRREGSWPWARDPGGRRRACVRTRRAGRTEAWVSLSCRVPGLRRPCGVLPASGVGGSVQSK